MDVTPTQTQLAAQGLYSGAIDGLMGPHTMSGLLCAAASARVPNATITAIAPALVGILAYAELTTPLRICHFLAQATEETANWATLVEYGGPTYCAQYDNRADLGNTEPGDGYQYRGRGPLQLTGRAGYAKIGGQIGADLIDHPDLLLTDMGLSAKSAAQFWINVGANQWADVDNLGKVTKLVNGGLNGFASRQGNLTRLKALWGM
jgi:putative chitinase